MNLLVTTTQALWCFDTTSRVAYRIHDGYDFYFGISYDDERIYVAAQDCVYGTEDLHPERQGRVLVFDYELNMIEELVPDFVARDPHQVYRHEDQLWLAGTADEVIGIYRDGAWEQWHPFGDPADQDHEARHHFNTIVIIEDRLYIVGHLEGDGQVHTFSYPDRTHLSSKTVGHGSHNYWHGRDGQGFTLSSGSGELCSIDHQVSYPISLGHFVRGAVLTPKEYFIGICSRTIRQERNDSNSTVARFDRSTARRDHFALNGGGQILEVRSPGVPDITHPSYLGNSVDVSGFEGRFKQLPLHPTPSLNGKRSFRRKFTWWLRLNLLGVKLPEF